MHKLKQLLKQNLVKTPFDTIFWSDPNIHTYQHALHSYQSLSPSQKQQLRQRIIRKLSKPKQPKYVIATLLLVHYLLPVGLRIGIQDIRVNMDMGEVRGEKGEAAERGFVDCYWSFLKSEESKYVVGDRMREKGMQEEIQYCQYAIQSVFTVLKFDFVMAYSQKHLQHKQLRQLILRKILDQTCHNIQFLTNFTIKHLPTLFTSTAPTLFHINQIYQKCIYITKQSSKLAQLQQISKHHKKIQYYAFDAEQNRKVELFLLGKQQEKREYISKKYAISEKKISDRENIVNNGLFESCGDILDENDVLLSGIDI